MNHNNSLPVMHNSTEQLDTIISLLPGHIYWKDKNGILMGCNDEQAKDIGLKSRYDVIGLTAYNTLPRDLADAITKIDSEVIETEKPRTVEEILTLPDGKKSIWLSHKVPLYDKRNNLIGLLGISVDITELKDTQNKLKEAEERLLLLSSSMAHELRTPLTAISVTATSLIKYLDFFINKYKTTRKDIDDDYIPDPQLSLISNSLDNILNSTRNANQFINMILTNLSSKKVEIGRRIQCSIKECLDLSIMEYALPTDYINKVDITGVKDFLFYGDQNLIKHIFFNLFKNAFYFIDKAGKGAITIWTTENFDYHQLHFKDTGTGIDKEKISKIFERFFTADTHHGTGVGLAFCKLVMETIGGDILCESEAGEYITFILSFPKVRA